MFDMFKFSFSEQQQQTRFRLLGGKELLHGSRECELKRELSNVIDGRRRSADTEKLKDSDRL